MMEDPTENCTLTWEECKQLGVYGCKWHGTCHREAMMQPEPEGDDK